MLGYICNHYIFIPIYNIKEEVLNQSIIGDKKIIGGSELTKGKDYYNINSRSKFFEDAQIYNSNLFNNIGKKIINNMNIVDSCSDNNYDLSRKAKIISI